MANLEFGMYFTTAKIRKIVPTSRPSPHSTGIISVLVYASIIFCIFISVVTLSATK